MLWQFGFLDVWHSNIFGGDFSQFWAGARVYVTGGDPYDPFTWPGRVQQLGGQDSVTPVFLYPPWVLFVLAPLGFLELPVAASVWIGSTLIFAAVGLFLLLDLRVRALPLAHTLVAFALVGSQPGIVNFYSGQWSFFLIGALSFSALCASRRRQSLAALFGSAMLIKPQLFLVAAPMLLRIAVARGQRRLALGLVALGAVAALASAIVFPRWWEPWSSVPGDRVGNIRAASLPNALRDIFGEAGLVTAVAALLVLIALAFAFSPRSDAAWPVWVGVSVNVAPYVFVYDQVILLVPLALAAGVIGRDLPGRSLVVTAVGVATLVVGGTLLHAFPGVEHGTLSYNGFVQFAVALLLIGALWRYRREPAVDPSGAGTGRVS